MITYSMLKKNAKKDPTGLPEIRLALLGDCATQHLATALTGMGFEYGYAVSVFDADYDQIDAQVMDQQSELFEFLPQTVLINMCTEKLYDLFSSTELEKRSSFADLMFEKISFRWSRIQAGRSIQILQFLFVLMDDRVFGNYALKVARSFSYQLYRLNYLILEAAQANKDVYPIDLEPLRSRLGSRAFHDDKMYYIAKMPFTFEALPYVAGLVMDTLTALNGHFNKCAVLDLDNTLWGGVIGDDGIENIEIGELGNGHAFSSFQQWFKELKNRGIILAVCSKNEEAAAKLPFEKHPEMVLRLSDFSLFLANWADKATNIRKIQQALNIGMDSIVFFDDNPFERNAVKSLIPALTVPELPDDPSEYLSYCQSLNLFEAASYSAEDEDRTRQYQAEAQRVILQQEYANYDDYLKDLDMVAVAAPFDRFHFSRIAQLTQRSNQFNLRTVRYTEGEIAELADNPAHFTLYFELRDKYGDHGLISVVILDKREKGELFISEWLMSCRVLKRGVEEFICNKIIDQAKENGYTKVVGEYIQTNKNAMVQNIYARLGFTEYGNGLFAADVYTYVKNTCYIKSEPIS